MKFAHTETGVVMDSQLAPDQATYTARFNNAVTATWTVTAIDDDITDGATNQNGVWVNSAPFEPPAHVPIAVFLSGSEFHTYCATVLATVNSTTAIEGMSRMGDIINALETAANTGGLCRIAFERYRAAGVPGGKYDLDDMTQLMSALLSKNVVTQQEAAALVGNWPKQ